MSIWSKILGNRNKPISFKDDYFGELSHELKTDIYGKKTSSRNLKGKVLFDTVEVKVNLDCGTGGPNNSQKDFFTLLSSEFDIIKTKRIIPLLEAQLANWLDKKIVRIDYDTDIILREIFIPDCLTNPIEWKLTMVYTPTDNFITIKFIDFIPDKKVTFDG